jgi:cell division protein ZipA
MESVEEETAIDEKPDIGREVDSEYGTDSKYGFADDGSEAFRVQDDERLEPGFSALDDEVFGTSRPVATSPRLSARDPEPTAPSEPEEVLIINVMAHEGQRFAGDALLDVVLRCGMRYGNMNIFHRHSDAQGDGAVLFSMANMVKPGTFDLDAMDEFTTPGISLFMTLPLNVESSIQAFETMLDSARRIAEALGGELKDENRSVMTRQTMEHCRQRIRDFERKQLSRMPH